jgi:tetratricopeptide (TPR) repeat protein
MATKSVPTVKSPGAKSAAVPVISKKPKVLAAVVDKKADDARKKVVSLYEAALKQMQAGKYEKAHVLFNEMLEIAPHDFADRIRMYIAACVAQISKGTSTFESHEERYDYAISLLNHGHYEDAREHFQEIILKDKSAHYAFYGMALLASLTGQTNKCIEHLTEAIRLNAMNRIQARSDSDFDNVADDPSFTELLYPEV